ncbi:MAG: HAD-IIA family hydrolase [Candidatus Marinimicrobia bacterium]|nr:HAD-IIA family hydrolase [Candidatus Neomarinimicrobiota bacterium]
MTPGIHQNQLKAIRHVALDMDGTIYNGSTLFPFTKSFLAGLKIMGIGYTFLTNNSSKSVSEYLKKIHALGLEATAENVYTSALATQKYLRNSYPTAKRVYILGTTGLKQEFRDAGYHVVNGNPDEEPEIVVVGFDTTLTFERLSKGAYWIKQGKPFIATHPDYICPTDEPMVLVDCGAICAALEKATGISPEAVPGKPNPLMLEGILEEHGLQRSELAMVGDRLYTDVAMAQASGAIGVLVLTGEAIETDLETSPFTPDIVVPSIKELGEQLRQSQN